MIVTGGEYTIAGVAHEFYVSGPQMRKRLGRDVADELAKDPDAYRAKQRELMAANMRDAGVIPPWYPIRGICAKCGPVPLPRGPFEVDSCPWCESFAGPKMTHEEFLQACREVRFERPEKWRPSIVLTPDGPWHRNSVRKKFGGFVPNAKPSNDDAG